MRTVRQAEYGSCCERRLIPRSREFACETVTTKTPSGLHSGRRWELQVGDDGQRSTGDKTLGNLRPDEVPGMHIQGQLDLLVDCLDYVGDWRRTLRRLERSKLLFPLQNTDGPPNYRVASQPAPMPSIDYQLMTCRCDSRPWISCRPAVLQDLRQSGPLDDSRQGRSR